MGEVKGLSLYVLIGAIMFGLFVGVGVTAIFGDGVGSSGGGLVETDKDIEPNEGEGIVEDDSNCVLATDEDFNGTYNGEFIYIGSSDCVKLPHVIKGVKVTSYKNMFYGTSVSKVVSDNLNITNMDSIFWGSKATELDLSRFNTSNVKDMSGMFGGSQATELDLSSFDTSNVTDMMGMFSGSHATEIKGLENFNTSKVKNMMNMFFDSQATELDLSSFDTRNVTDMSGMFYISQAKELDVSSFNTSNVTDMWVMFFGSKSKELDLSSFDTSNVTNMEDMFEGSQTKTVYARTQVDADNFNTLSNKPDRIQVIVKQ